ncbi:hypothetical protein O6H91_04G028300 [Diphasiastrum complanatum]|uniref:Uncharacterized protein n=1 Tax=Diphasiastrum complanatum TaxID=34168 RepID=A0ACC2DVD8_DIPCM|nr:hypothetical protein O6H91_04G028300 [Diphasiastrum complanatum]
MKEYKSGEASFTSFVLLCLFFLVLVSISAAEQVPWNDDVLGLIVLKADFHSPNDALSSWSVDDANPCNWTGITCSSTSGRVIELSLDGLSLSGTIGRGLFKLDQLRSLSLANNNLSGTISPEITALPFLRQLNLSKNALSGSIPSMGNLTYLRILDLSSNYLVGSIPSELFQGCSGLHFLSLSGNSLEGDIPATISACRVLSSLDLSSNKLSGSIPSSMLMLYSLRMLNLSCNTLHGYIPSGIGSLRKLTHLDLHSNGLNGKIPPEVGGCASLIVLDLSNNSLSGELPFQLQNLISLQAIRLSGNYLSGTILEGFGNMSKLIELDLSENSFSGQMPLSLGSLDALQSLNLARNSLWGAIPRTLASCTELLNLDLRDNDLTGSIPTELFGMKLLQLIVSNNQLSVFPSDSPAFCTSLQTLDLSRNVLVGGIPAMLSRCSQLQVINLKQNLFSGQIPMDIGNLRYLKFLDLSYNQLSGAIPQSLGNATLLVQLHLQHNVLSGQVPLDLGKCTNLTEIDLSHNNCTGVIPVGLAKITGLQYLDVSFNNLSGEIPQNFGKLQNLQGFNVSHNKLCGPIPIGGFFPHSSKTSFSENSELCGVALGTVCPVVPKPIVLNPNASRTPNPLTRPNNHPTRIVLSISAIIAISAAAVIALGIIVVTLLNIRAQTHPKPNFFVIESLPASPSEELAVGRLVMFTDGSEVKADDFLPNANALLNKGFEIGRGGFGVMYKAILADGQAVAVKKLMVAGLVKSQEEFEREIQALGAIQHPNLVSLQGYYWTSKMQILIYDYVPNGNLYTRLHERGMSEAPLNWSERFKIALGTAYALAHLHHECQPQVIHYDVKSSNILLDEHCRPRVSDYGLAKLLTMHDRYVTSSKFQSALGYMAPEFACQSLRINEKCDVYGFGVILLELVTGRRPVEYMEDDVVILCDYVRSLLDDSKALLCVDSTLRTYPEEEVLPVIKLGLLCTSQIPSNRPFMMEVVQILELIKPLEDIKDNF